jgi:hypothetical protein
MVEEPHAVACFLKKVLRCMGEPLCTFKLYSRFRDLAGKIQSFSKVSKDHKGEEKLKRLTEICLMLPEINKQTFIYLIKFFRKVSCRSTINKVRF